MLACGGGTAFKLPFYINPPMFARDVGTEWCGKTKEKKVSTIAYPRWITDILYSSLVVYRFETY